MSRMGRTCCSLVYQYQNYTIGMVGQKRAAAKIKTVISITEWIVDDQPTAFKTQCQDPITYNHDSLLFLLQENKTLESCDHRVGGACIHLMDGFEK